MRLLNIIIENFRCIEHQEFTIKEIDTSHTYTLIGVNETGKSSFLKAISLIDNEETINYPLDYFNEKKPVMIHLLYQIDLLEITKLKDELSEKGFDKELISKIAIKEDVVKISLSFDPSPNPTRKLLDEFDFETPLFPEYTLSGEIPVKKDPEQTLNDFDLTSYFRKNFPDFSF